MNNTEMRVKLAKEKARMKIKQSENKRIFELLIVSCMLAVLWITIYTDLIYGKTQKLDAGMYGSMLLYEDARGYVLVGVVSFVMAVTLTLLCVKYKENKKRYDNKKGATNYNEENM